MTKQRRELGGVGAVRVAVASMLLACNVMSGANDWSVDVNGTTSDGDSLPVLDSYGVAPPSNRPAGDAGSSTASADAGDPRLRVFVTSTKVLGGVLKGVENADAKCTQLANAAGHPGSYVAWLAGTSSPVLARLTASGPWYRYDDVLAVRSRAELTSGGITAPINVDENLTANVTDGVWTGVTAAGELSGTCFDWTAERCLGACIGLSGKSNDVTTGWTSSVSSMCVDSALRLYCFQNGMGQP